MQNQQYYEILQLSPSANERQIKQAYYRSARLYHTDISEHPDAEQFTKICRAYKHLIQSKSSQSRELSLYRAPIPLYRRLSQWLNRNIRFSHLSWREILLLIILMLLVPGYYRAQAWQQQPIDVSVIQQQLAAKAKQIQKLQLDYKQCFSNVSTSVQTQCVLHKQQQIAQLDKKQVMFLAPYQELIKQTIAQHHFFYAEQLLELWEQFEQMSQQPALWHRLAVEREVISLPRPQQSVATTHIEIQQKPVEQQNKKVHLKLALEQCVHYLKLNRLTRGQQGNALQCYRDLSTQYPQHKAITKGIQKIERRLAALAKQALQQHKISKAKQHVASLKKVNRHSSHLRHLKHQIAALQQVITKNKKKEVSMRRVMSQKCRHLLRQFSIGKSLSAQQQTYIVQQCR